MTKGKALKLKGWIGVFKYPIVCVTSTYGGPHSQLNEPLAFVSAFSVLEIK